MPVNVSGSSPQSQALMGDPSGRCWRGLFRKPSSGITLRATVFLSGHSDSSSSTLAEVSRNSGS
jgi:hypothetical protein